MLTQKRFGHVFVVPPSLHDHLKKSPEEVKRGFLQQLAGFDKTQVGGGRLASFPAAEPAEAFPQVGERPDGTFAAVVVYLDFPAIHISG